ncbi:19442_t:CDS:10 [Entrophospora sp. SA101]|nr:19442_t:CDS:10 [Entrophospora sp. SA101]
MSAPFKKLTVKKLPLPVESSTEDSRYWGKFKTPTKINEVSSVVSIHFSPSKPHDFAVTSSAYVKIYSAQTFKVKKIISRFENTAFSGNIRNDGKLLVAGDGNGLIQVFNLGSRAILRTFRGHKLPVHVTKFFPNNNKQVLSCSDDKTVRVWDIPEQGSISVLEGHKTPTKINEVSSVVSIHFSPSKPHDFAVTSSAYVKIYSAQTFKVKKIISRFENTAFSGNIRNDGKLLVAGDGNGLIQVFNLGSRAILRTFRGHKLPVDVTKFFPNNNKQVLSCSDDKTVRVWDIPEQGSISVLEGHKDYIRSGLISHDNPQLVLSGSYDKTIKLWDLRNNKCNMTIDHGAPVEEVLMFPGGGIVLSAGGPTLNVWDMFAGGRLIRSVSNHQKTITTMCFDASFSRLLTGSLDHHVKIYDVQNYEVVHSFTYSKPILCINDTHLATGMTSGLLSVRHRKPDHDENVAKNNENKIRVGSYQYFTRGYSYNGSKEDFVVESERYQNLAIYEQYLKKFEYTKALDAVFRTGTRAILTISMLQELIYRDGLRQALVNRDETTLEPILKFIMKWINDPKYTELLIDVGNLIFEIYGQVICQSPKIQELLQSLKAKVKKELEVQKEIFKVIGSLEMLFAKNSIVSSTTTTDNVTSEITNTATPTPTTSQ